MTRTNGSSKDFLLIIDPQRDFHGGGSLTVPGADADSERITDMIMYEKNIGKISEVFVTLDSHHRNHISHAAFWLEKKSFDKDSTNRPSDFTQISNEDVQKGKYFPVDKSLLKYCDQYTKSLEARKRFTHTIFPEHCLIGSLGHAVVANIHTALQEWSTFHFKNINYIMKGTNCLTEMYSVIEAEVPVSSDPGTATNTHLLEQLLEADRLIICGQALSHCVQYTVRDILKHWKRDEKQIIILIDGSSSVNSPDSIKSAEIFVTEMRGLITVCKVADVFNL